MLKYQQSRSWVMWWRHHLGWRGRLGALVALAGLLALRVPASSELRAELRAPPHKLAAHLADFNSLRLLYPHISSWKLESQWSNYTSWRYSLSFSCGARCAGAAAVRAHDEYAAGAPAHGHAHATAHSGQFHMRTCRTLPLLFWPAFCEELEVEWWVEGADGTATARYTEQARWRRALGAALLAGLAGGGLAGGGLSDARAAHLQALREAFL